MSKAVEQARGKKVDILAGLPLHPADGAEAGLTADPHVWLDPVLFARVAARIGAALARPDTALTADLDKLDREYRQGLSDCKRHEIVTSHAAFGYLAARYGLEQVSITGLSPEAEPTPQQLEHVIQIVRRTHATTVFFETLLSPRLADTVAREVGARTAVLDPIEGLTPAEQKRGRYLSDSDAAQSRDATEGPGMPLALRLERGSFRLRPLAAGSRATSISRWSVASSSRSRDRTAAARRRSSGSWSGWNSRHQVASS